MTKPIVLTLHAGSSSLKFALLTASRHTKRLWSGAIDGVGPDSAANKAGGIHISKPAARVRVEARATDEEKRIACHMAAQLTADPVLQKTGTEGRLTAAHPRVLETLRDAVRPGLVEPRQAGDADAILRLWLGPGWQASADWIIPAESEAGAAACAVTKVRSGAAINITPDLAAQGEICQNAIELFDRPCIAEPCIAVPSADGTVTGSIASTHDTTCLALMARRDQITGARVGGPLALDNAISARAARETEILSDAAGEADVLPVPDLVSGPRAEASVAAAPQPEHACCAQRGTAALAQAMQVSCHSFIHMAKSAEPLMNQGGSRTTLSFLIDELVGETAARSPVRRSVTADDVGRPALLLASDHTTAIMAEIRHVDAGFHADGMNFH